MARIAQTAAGSGRPHHAASRAPGGRCAAAKSLPTCFVDFENFAADNSVLLAADNFVLLAEAQKKAEFGRLLLTFELPPTDQTGDYLVTFALPLVAVRSAGTSLFAAARMR